MVVILYHLPVSDFMFSAIASVFLHKRKKKLFVNYWRNYYILNAGFGARPNGSTPVHIALPAKLSILPSFPMKKSNAIDYLYILYTAEYSYI